MLPKYTITTPPTDKFATDLAEFLRLDQPDDIALAQGMRLALESAGEAYTNRVFRPTTFVGEFPCLDYDYRSGLSYLEICRSPVTAVSLVEQSVDDVFSAVTDAVIAIHPHTTTITFPTRVTFTENEPFPVRVTFTAGYADGSAERALIDQGLKAHVGYVYENRGDVKGDFDIDAIPDTAKMFYNPVRIIPGYG